MINHPRMLALGTLLVIIIIVWTGLYAASLLLDDGINFDLPTNSIDQSRAKNIFICKVTANPSSVFWDSRKVSFSQIWVERKVKTHYLGLTYKRFDSYFLVFNLKDGFYMFKALKDFNGPFFKIESNDSFFSFSKKSGRFYCPLSFNDFQKSELTIAIIDNLTSAKIQKLIQLQWGQ